MVPAYCICISVGTVQAQRCLTGEVDLGTGVELLDISAARKCFTGETGEPLAADIAGPLFDC